MTMNAAEYHARPELSSSLAQLIITQSPLHAWTASRALNPNYVSEEKEAFDIGSAAHALLLEGQDRMVVIQADSYRTKDAQMQRDAARAEGRHPVLAHKYQDVLKMRDVAVRAIAECEDLNGLVLSAGRAEHVVLWNDGGVACRARPDWMRDALVLDYKSTTDATPRGFARQIARMGYHYQAEFYSRGIEKLIGQRPTFVFLAQEVEAPYACTFHACDGTLRTIAESDVTAAIKTWGACLAANRFPAYDHRVIHWAEAAPWQIAEAEARMA